MIRYIYKHLIGVTLLSSASLLAQSSEPQIVTDICDCQAAINCQAEEQLILSLRTRKSHCPTYLDQQLQHLKANNHLSCDLELLPERMYENHVTTNLCEQRYLDVIHCNDNRGGQRICQKIDRSPDQLCSEVSCTFNVKSLTKEIKRIHELISYVNKPVSTNHLQSSYKSTKSSLQIKDPIDPDEPIEVPITPEEDVSLELPPLPERRYFFITQGVGLKAASMAKKVCDHIEATDLESALLKKYYLSLLYELSFLQKASHLPNIVDCSYRH